MSKSASSGNSDELFKAAQYGNLETVNDLLEEGANPNATRDYYGETPLFIASQNGRIGVVKVLLEKGAHPNKAGVNGATPLLAATQYGHIEIVKVLLEKKADPNTKFIFFKDVE